MNDRNRLCKRGNIDGKEIHNRHWKKLYRRMKDLRAFLEEYDKGNASIFDYCKENRVIIDVPCEIIDIRNELLEVFDEVPEGFYEDPYKDYILENLNTHDKKMLISKLENILDIIDVIDGPTDKSSFIIQYNKNGNEEEARKIIEFFGWYISKDVANQLTICPKYSEDVSNYVIRDCHGYLYHICKNEFLDSILKSRLKCKTGKRNPITNKIEKYREFPERIYCIAAPPKEVSKAVIEVCSEIGIKDFSKYSILKLEQCSRLYHDDCMMSKYACFTYNNIPAKCILKSCPLDEFINKYYKK